jgi:hypothetical protein
MLKVASLKSCTPGKKSEMIRPVLILFATSFFIFEQITTLFLIYIISMVILVLSSLSLIRIQFVHFILLTGKSIQNFLNKISSTPKWSPS